MSSSDIIEKLPDFVIPEYHEALGILFANRDWIPRFVDESGEERLGIIELVKNNFDEAREAIQLAQKKWAKHVEKASSIIPTIQKFNVVDYTGMVKSVMADPMQISAGIVSKDFVEGVTATILAQYLSKHQGQAKFFDNEKILKQLSNSKLRLIEPWQQASVCGFCHNFELLLSSYPRKTAPCPQCAREMFTVRIYKMNSSYERHKLENKDLPLFIKSYINYIRPDIEVHVTYKIKKQDSMLLGDIDVYLPKNKTGLECKLFVNPFPQGNQFDSYRGELLDAFLKYANYGLDRLIGITNLTQEDAENLENSLKEELKKEGFGEKHLQICHFSIEKLVSIIEEELSLIPISK